MQRRLEALRMDLDSLLPKVQPGILDWKHLIDDDGHAMQLERELRVSMSFRLKAALVSSSQLLISHHACDSIIIMVLCSHHW